MPKCKRSTKRRDRCMRCPHCKRCTIHTRACVAVERELFLNDSEFTWRESQKEKER